MKLHVILGQRKCRYEGEYAPEALGIIDGNAADDNPTWVEEQVGDHRKSGLFSAVDVLVVRVPDKAIDDLLTPKAHEVDGTVES